MDPVTLLKGGEIVEFADDFAPPSPGLVPYDQGGPLVSQGLGPSEARAAWSDYLQRYAVALPGAPGSYRVGGAREGEDALGTFLVRRGGHSTLVAPQIDDFSPQFLVVHVRSEQGARIVPVPWREIEAIELVIANAPS